MSIEAKIRFCEHTIFKDRETGEIPGIECVRRETKDGRQYGQAINPEKLAGAQSLNFVLFETDVNLQEGQNNLTELLASNPGAIRWVDHLREWAQSEIPLEVFIEELPFVPLVYSQSPNDYFRRVREDDRYRCPEGIIDELPQGAFYGIVAPIAKDTSGKWLRGTSREAVVTRADGMKEGCWLFEVGQERLPHTPGVLLGEIRKKYIRETRGRFEGHFPFQIYFKVGYLVRIRDAHRMNPIFLEFHFLGRGRK